MKNIFLNFGLNNFSSPYKELITSSIALLFAMIILIYFDAKTLFLATLLLCVISIRMINLDIKKNGDTKDIAISKLIGLWFALSVAPATSIPLKDITLFSNGFLIQSLGSFILYIYFYTKQPSIIGRLKNTMQGGVNIVGSDIIAGFTAGISSALIWQIILNISL